MTPDQRQELIRLLELGEEISPEWARVLFPPEKREYELVYHGKEREEDIIADTLAVPLQPVRTFGKNGDDWHNMLIFGDNLQVMKTLLEMKKEDNLCNADATGGVRLVYIDPPFATKQDFQGTQDDKAYQDKLAGAEFLEFLRRRLLLIRQLLADDGTLYLHMDWRKAHYVKVLCDEIFTENRFRNEVIWYYRRWSSADKGPKLDPKPFTLYNAGLYDFSKLKELAWKDWRFFALQLFQCRDEPHRINGIDFDGYRQGASVLVFNHMEAKHKDARVTEDTIQDIHDAVGSRVGGKVFIIAPALTFDFQQDYIDFDKVRYYALRIPYSIIHELHRREFTALKQPSDELAVNETVEAVGFDFIRTPELKYKTGIEKPRGELFEYGFIKIETFRSDAVVREPVRKRGNLETLSMVMLDFDYDEGTKIFDLDEVHYADAIEKGGWKVRFRTDQLGKKAMAVFLDIYGNEARVLIDSTVFGKSAAKQAPKKNRSKKK